MDYFYKIDDINTSFAVSFPVSANMGDPWLSSTPPSKTVTRDSSLTPYNLILLVFFSLMLTIGSFGNAMVIVIIILSKSLWKASNFYILSVCGADFLLCAFYAPYCIVVMTNWPWPYGCEVMAVLMNIALLASFLSLTAVAINRYLLVRFSYLRYSRLYSNARTCLSIVIIWLLDLVINFPLLLGYGDIGFDARLHICTISMADTDTYFYELFVVLLVGLPCIIIIFVSYFSIWRVFRKRVGTLVPPMNTLATTHRMPQHSRRNYKLTRNLFIITTIFSVCWIPTVLLIFIESSATISDIAYQIIVLLSISHSILHPYLFTFLNKNLPSAYRDVSRRLSRNQIGPGPWTMTECSTQRERRPPILPNWPESVAEYPSSTRDLL